MDVCWAFSSLVLLCSLLVDTELPNLENIPLEISCFNDGLVPKSILNRAAKAGALLSTMFFSPQPNQCKNGVEFAFIPKNLSYVEQKTCQTVMKDGITDDHAVQLTAQYAEAFKQRGYSDSITPSFSFQINTTLVCQVIPSLFIDAAHNGPSTNLLYPLCFMFYYVSI